MRFRPSVMTLSSPRPLSLPARRRRPALRWLAAFALSIFCPAASRATTIDWSSPVLGINLTSSGAPLTEDFLFELGAFDAGFVPTAANTAQWAGKWRAASRSGYNVADALFSATHSYSTNVPPFLPNAAAYIWGHNCAPANGEWVLMSSSLWRWPLGSPSPVGSSFVWNSLDADSPAILGQVNAPAFDLKTAVVPVSPVPGLTGDQWRAAYFTPAELASSAVSGWNADPDGDQLPNLVEYALCRNPRSWSDGGTSTILTVGNEKYLSLQVPKNPAAAVTWKIEVSSDLATWKSGAGFTVDVVNTASTLQVRDATPWSAATSARFIRLTVSLLP